MLSPIMERSWGGGVLPARTAALQTLGNPQTPSPRLGTTAVDFMPTVEKTFHSKWTMVAIRMVKWNKDFSEIPLRALYRKMTKKQTKKQKKPQIRLLLTNTSTVGGTLVQNVG